ncbi:hypothetical protein Lepto7375DRAFT_3429 [Leptolyngbya sp. PCC 7375]|nr:hypothetical protein Lepto7375DRAFT_3429 [Leptolyngbya sp. PCC 7375]
MENHQPMTKQPRHKEGDDYGGIEAGVSLLAIMPPSIQIGRKS